MPRFRRLHLEGFRKVLADEETGLLREHFALIYVARRARRRFSENCVHLKESQEEATRGADPDHGLHAAVVLGPSKSSEGIHMYYLVRWLDR